MNISKILLFCLVSASVACSNRIRTYADYDSTFDLSDYSTYGWGKTVPAASAIDSLLNNEENNKRMRTAILGQLQVRGYTLNTENPDFRIYFHIIVNDQSILATEPFGYSYSFFWMQLGTNVLPYDEGTLIIDCMDAKTNNLIWRGWALSPFDDINTSEKMDEQIKTVVAKIFKKFPNTGKHAYVRDDKI